MDNLLHEFLVCVDSLKQELIFQESQGEKWILAHGICEDLGAKKPEANTIQKSFERPVSQSRQPTPLKKPSAFSENTMPPPQEVKKASPPSFAFPVPKKPCEIVFVRFCPSFQELGAGISYSDEGAQLLDKIIMAMKWNPENVHKTYLCAVPPDQFSEEQILECRQKLFSEMRFLCPKILIAWGERVSQVLSGTKKNLEELHGTFLPQPQGFVLMSSWDPAYLIKRPEFKHTVWADLKKIEQHLK